MDELAGTRIAMINRMAALTRGGGEIWDLNMARQLEQLGADVIFYVATPLMADPPNPVTEFDAVEVPVPRLQEVAYAAPKGVGGVLSDLDRAIFSRRVASALKDRDQDVIHINTFPEFAWYTDHFDRPVTIKMNGPPHSLWHDVINPFSSTYELLERFDGVVTTGVTTDAIERNSTCDVTTINPGVDIDRFTPSESAIHEQSDANRGPVVLFVGRFVPEKNIGLLVNAVSELQSTYSDIELVLVGDGPVADKIDRRIQAANMESNTRLPGYVPNEQLPAYYREADVFALSSRQDNHPITLLEAMASGTPVVAPDVGWIPEIVDDERTGLVYDAESRAALQAALDTLFRNPRECERMGAAARDVAVEEFSWRQRGRRFAAFFEDVLDEFRGTRGR